MARPDTAPVTELAHNVYADAVAPLEYLGFEDIPAKDEVTAFLDQSMYLRGRLLSRLLIVPPSANSIGFAEWDERLRGAYVGKKTAAPAGSAIVGLCVHPVFSQDTLHLAHETPTIGVLPATERERQLGNKRLSFAGYVIAQVARSLKGESPEDSVETRTRSVFPNMPSNATDRYDALSSQYARVVPEVRVGSADICQSIIKIYGREGDAPETVADTPSNRRLLEPGGLPKGSHAILTAVPTNDKVIQVLPRSVRPVVHNPRRTQPWLIV